jgi:hypothetical protein
MLACRVSIPVSLSACKKSGPLVLIFVTFDHGVFNWKLSRLSGSVEILCCMWRPTSFVPASRAGKKYGREEGRG